MDDSNALSPEVKELIEKIRQNAAEYTRAFDILMQQNFSTERQKADIINLINELKSEFHNHTTELNETYKHVISEFEEKTNDTIKIYYELENIQKLRDNVISMQNAMRQDIVELKNNYQAYKDKITEDFNTTITILRGSIEKELASEAQKIEVRLQLNIKYIETRLQQYEQLLLGIKDTLTKEIGSIKEDIFGLNDYYIKLEENVDASIIRLKNKVEDTENRLMKQMGNTNFLGPSTKKPYEFKVKEKPIERNEPIAHEEEDEDD